MVPGPTALPPEVVAAGARPILDPRSEEFVAIWEDVIERLRGVFQTEGEVLVFGASGSGAMDSAVATSPPPASGFGSLPAGTSGSGGRRSAPTTALTRCIWRASGAARSTRRRWPRRSPASATSTSSS